jgi:hypothetical protein
VSVPCASIRLSGSIPIGKAQLPARFAALFLTALLLRGGRSHGSPRTPVQNDSPVIARFKKQVLRHPH